MITHLLTLYIQLMLHDEEINVISYYFAYIWHFPKDFLFYFTLSCLLCNFIMVELYRWHLWTT